MRNMLSKALTVTALAGALTMFSTPANAEFLDFTVDEGGVPGAADIEHIVDKLNGGYTELLEFTGLNFASSAYANFAAYFANEGMLLIPTQLNAPAIPFGDLGYGLYALFTAEGSVSGTSLIGSDAYIEVWLDPEMDTDFSASLVTAGVLPTPTGTADDILIMFDANLLSGSGIPGTPGAFNLLFGNPTITNPAGEAYWPTLSSFVVTTQVNGDFDDFDFTGIQTVTGDLSAVFQDASVPEPATLTMFGLGLAGVAAIARRRRKSAA